MCNIELKIVLTSFTVGAQQILISQINVEENHCNSVARITGESLPKAPHMVPG